MSDVKDRIRKLLAMATDNRGNEHENEIAMRMANRLMLQHGLDASDIEQATGKKTTFVWASTIIPVGERASHMSWRPVWTGFLSYGVAQFTDCKVETHVDDKYGHCVKFMGEEADIEFAGWLFKRLRDYGYAESKSVAGRNRDTFLKSYAIRLQARMKDLRRERDAAMKATATKTGTALMVIQNKVALRDAEFGKQRVKNTRYRASSDGFHQGRAAADRVNFNRPIGSGGLKQLS